MSDSPFNDGQFKTRHWLKDAIVTPVSWDKSLTVLNGGVYSQDGQLFRPAERSHLMSKFSLTSSETIDPGEAAETIRGTCLYLGHYTHHYGHFLLETLARFWALGEDNTYHKFIFHSLFDLKTYSPTYSPAAISFACFDVESDKVLIARNKIRVEKLVIPTRLVSVDDGADPEQASVYQKIAAYCQQHYATNHDAFPKRLYLSRKKLRTSGSQDRFVSNEVEIEQLFGSFGFTVIYPEELSFEKQVLMFNSAEMIAGVGGSAMHNSVFMPETGMSITLGIPREPNAPNLNQVICDELSNVRAEFIPYQGQFVDEERGDFEIDTKSLAKTLGTMLMPTSNKSLPALHPTATASVAKHLDRQQAVICILGMHRSGTSSLTGSIQTAGMFAGDVSRSTPFQHSGDRENKRLVLLNDSILRANQGSWDGPPISLTWSAQNTYDRDRNVAELYRQSPVWMFKDPRTLLTLPFWQEGINALYPIGTFRHPMSVALSLYRREELPLRQGFDLWIHYNRLLLQAFHQSSFPLLCFDLQPAAYIDQLSQVIQHLNRQLNGLVSLSFSKAKAFYQPDAVDHHNYEALLTGTIDSNPHFEADQARIATAKELYEDLRQAAGVCDTPDRTTEPVIQIPLDDTLEAYQTVRQNQTNNALLLFMLGNAQHEAGDTTSALASYRQALTVEPNQIDVQKKLANLLLKQGDTQAATDVFEQLLGNLPTDINIYIQVIILQNNQGNHLRALELCLQALKLHPHRVHLHILKGNTQRQLGDLEAAINSFRAGLKTDATNFHIHLALANLLRQVGQLDESETICKKALVLDPSNPNIYACLGDVQRLKENDEGGIASYHQALELGSQSVYVYVHLSQVMIRQNRFTESKSILEKGRAIAPDNPDIYRFLGDIDRLQGNDESAIDHYRQGLELDPNRVGVMINLAMAVRRLGRHTDADHISQENLNTNYRNETSPTQRTKPSIASYSAKPSES